MDFPSLLSRDMDSRVFAIPDREFPEHPGSMVGKLESIAQRTLGI